MKRYIPYLIALIALTFFSVDVDAQCAMCRAQAETNAQSGDSVVGGLNNGILYLMGIPYVLLFFLFRKKIFKFFKQFGSIYKDA